MIDLDEVLWFETLREAIDAARARITRKCGSDNYLFVYNIAVAHAFFQQ